MNRVFIGYDERQRMSYHVLAQSIIERSSKPVAITALRLEQMPSKKAGLTPFTYSRFLVPYLCEWSGAALFLDADMVLNGDICELFDLFDDRYAIMVRKQGQARFEWASLMLFNCAHPENRTLTPERLDGGDVNGLHGIEWCAPEAIGDLPQEWNFCVGYDAITPETKEPKLLHYTQGVPMWPETKDCALAQYWATECNEMHKAATWEHLMGRSVHAKFVYKRLNRQS